MFGLAIYDLTTGRISGGHQDDYLLALEKALQRYAVRIFAPYRDQGGSAPDSRNRLARLWLGFRIFTHLLAAREPLLVLVPNPAPLDFAIAFLAGIFQPVGKGRLVFVMRRSSDGIVRSGLQSRVLEFMIREMVHRKRFAMVSDSRAAMKFWREKTGADGPIVSIPVRRGQHQAKAVDAPIVVGLLGAFRLEKGAIHYDDVIAAALAAAEDVVVECQLSLYQQDARERDLASMLLKRWTNNSRARLHRGYLDDAAFSALLFGVDIIVLPYDAPQYGSGTSGVMFEALMAGRLVAATRIAWGVEEFSSNPNMIWLDDAGREKLDAGIAKAVAMVRARRAAGAITVPVDDTFQTSWLAAIDVIVRDMEFLPDRSIMRES